MHLKLSVCELAERQNHDKHMVFAVLSCPICNISFQFVVISDSVQNLFIYR